MALTFSGGVETVGASSSSVGFRVPSAETRLVLHMPLSILKFILHFTRQMELIVLSNVNACSIRTAV